MTLAVWLDDEVGLQAQANPMEGVYFRLPEDNFDRCFSKYGFVYSLKEFEINYPAVVENRLPPIPRHINNASSQLVYMLIDHYGEVWQIDYWSDREGRVNAPQMSIFSMPAGKVKTLVACTDEGDLELLTGFVMANRNKDEINQFIFDKKLGHGKRLTWLSKKDIVERLNKEFPLEKDPGESNPFAQAIATASP